MDVAKYFESLSLELESMKDRVRYLIHDQHWLTDGEWKESVLRSVLRRHLPASVEVGSGFVVGPNSSSGQIDILIYDAAKPVLFRDGDLVFLASDAVKAIIEVKSKIQSKSHLKESLSKLANKSQYLFENTPGTQFETHPPFVGLFAYEWGVQNNNSILEAVKEAATEDSTINPQTRVVNHIALGSEFFIRYWKTAPTSDRGVNYCSWHSYKLKNKAYGYFIHNVVDSVCTDSVDMNPTLWFPESGKEVDIINRCSLFGNSDNA